MAFRLAGLLVCDKPLHGAIQYAGLTWGLEMKLINRPVLHGGGRGDKLIGASASVSFASRFISATGINPSCELRVASCRLQPIQRNEPNQS